MLKGSGDGSDDVEDDMHNAQVTADGARIRWVEIPGRPGSSRTRVCLHGLGASSGPYFTASATHPLLAGDRSLLMDLLGFGISDRPTDFGYTLEEHADAVAAALEAAGAYGTDVIAHSMGGAVAIVLAARHPHLVARLVLVDANLDPMTPGPGGRAAAASRPTRRRSSWRTAGPRCATGWGRTGGRPCVWRAGRRCTAARCTWPAGRRRRCANCCWS